MMNDRIEGVGLEDKIDSPHVKSLKQTN